jgi:hypothetical protein
MFSFPQDLADIVSESWTNLVAGDYTPPLCPSIELLQQLFEVSYLAASCPEEMRFPKFNIIATPQGYGASPRGYAVIEFDKPRPLSVQEVRRLAPTIDIAKSAIWVSWGDEGWSISGLLDLGTSWHRAKMGLSYRYRAPADLFVQVDRPGRIRVNQGPYHVATLEDGSIVGADGIDLNFFFHPIATTGIELMESLLQYPAYELPRYFLEFEFIALVNTYSAIASEISTGGHGGTVIFALSHEPINQEQLRIKYQCTSSILKDAFVTFINARHVQGDYGALHHDGHAVPDAVFCRAEIASRDAYEALIEVTRFIASLSGCDGAIVLNSDLTLVGFGAEICAELDGSVDILEGKTGFNDDLKNCNIEQFGMRHRSAIKLASQTSSFRVMAVSQDGPVSGVYRKAEQVVVEKGIKLSNLNMPWA